MHSNRPNKIFVLGLPRTGTTSFCVKCLELGLTVAHTAYTEETFNQAQVIADTPIFNDFVALDAHYPDSKFVLLERQVSLWLPSIKQLLNRMFKNLTREDGGFNPIIKRCYLQTFSPFSLEAINDDQFLENCYQRHREKVLTYFRQRENDLLIIDVADKHAPEKLAQFLNFDPPLTAFPVINKGGKVTAWKDLKHPHIIASTKNGKTTALSYLSLNR